MASLLSDSGYSCRIIPDRLLGPSGATFGYPPPEYFLVPVNPDLAVTLAIMSGSGASADTPPPPPGVPVMMGEHVCLGDNIARAGSLFMYMNTFSTDPNESNGATKYMKVIAPDHPIMKGIPLDAQGRVKIFREPYPEEEMHVPPGGKRNFEYRWCTQSATNPAPATTILGVLDGTEERACFAVAEVGGTLANGVVNSNRLVHLFLNENGSGGSRRVFNALTVWGRILFLRAAQWALGEELQPYQSFRIIDVSSVEPQRVKLTWQGSERNHYRILGSTDMTNWVPVIDDIPGGTGEISRTLDVSSGPQALFMTIAALP
jgi:hypothetical protein